MATNDVEIYSLALACHDTLEKFVPHSPDNDGGKFIRLVDALHHRINAWGNYFKVFAAESDSLDRLLDHDPTVKRLITQNLSQLLSNLQNLIEEFSYTETDRPRRGVVQLNLAEDLLRSPIYNATERSLDRLERLGTTIRQSLTTGLQQPTLFTNEELDESNEMMLIVKNMFEYAPESLVALLGRNAFLIYTRLRYQKQHQMDLQTNALYQNSTNSSTVLSGIDYSEPPEEEPECWTMCERCFEYYRSEQFEDIDWLSRHDDRDLMPYVCLFEDCAADQRRFESFDEWKTHMNNHSPRWAEIVHTLAWFCDEKRSKRSRHSRRHSKHPKHPKHPERVIFQNPEDAEAHMREEHSDVLSKAQISSIVKANTIQLPRPPSDCPICCRTIQKDEYPTTTGLHEIDTTENTENISVTEHSLRSEETERKRVRFDVTPPSKQALEPTSSTELEDDDDSDLWKHNISVQELQDQMAKHVAEHLKDLALFASRYSPSTGHSDGSSAVEDSAPDTKDDNLDHSTFTIRCYVPETSNSSHGTANIELSVFLIDTEHGGANTLQEGDVSQDNELLLIHDVSVTEDDWEGPFWHEQDNSHYVQRPNAYGYERIMIQITFDSESGSYGISIKRKKDRKRSIAATVPAQEEWQGPFWDEEYGYCQQRLDPTGANEHEYQWLGEPMPEQQEQDHEIAPRSAPIGYYPLEEHDSKSEHASDDDLSEHSQKNEPLRDVTSSDSQPSRIGYHLSEEDKPISEHANDDNLFENSQIEEPSRDAASSNSQSASIGYYSLEKDESMGECLSKDDLSEHSQNDKQLRHTASSTVVDVGEWEPAQWHQEYQLYYQQRTHPDGNGNDGYDYRWLGRILPEGIQYREEHEIQQTNLLEDNLEEESLNSDAVTYVESNKLDTHLPDSGDQASHSQHKGKGRAQYATSYTTEGASNAKESSLTAAEDFTTSFQAASTSYQDDLTVDSSQEVKNLVLRFIITCRSGTMDTISASLPTREKEVQSVGNRYHGASDQDTRDK